MTESSTDDAAHNGAVRGDPIGEHDGQRHRIRQAERHDSALLVVPTRVIELDIGRHENLGRELEIESALGQVALALRGIPVVGHGYNLRLYIHRNKGAGPCNENAFCCIAASQSYSCSPTGGRSVCSNAC